MTDISTLLLIGWVAEWAGTPYHVPYIYFTFDFIIFGFYVLFNLFLFWYFQHIKVPYYFKMQIQITNKTLQLQKIRNVIFGVNCSFKNESPAQTW